MRLALRGVRWPLLLLLLSAALAWLTSSDRDLAVAFGQRLLLGLTAFLAVVWLLTRPTLPLAVRLRLALWGLTAAQIVLALLALIGTRWPAAKLLPLTPLYDRLPTLLADTLHPNVAAAALLLLLPFAGATWRLSSRERAWRWQAAAALGLLAPALLTLLLTQSRAAWLGLAGMAWALIWQRTARRPLFGAASAVAAAGLFWLAWPRLAADWLSRQMVWAQGLVMLQDFGLTGAGLGSFGVTGPALYPDFGMGAADFIAPHAHNLFLQTGVDLGIAGLIAYLALLLTAAGQAHAVWRRAAEPLAQMAAGAALLSLLGLCLDGLLDVGVWGTQGGFVAWLVLAAAVGVGTRDVVK